jgi:hypothetical protein
MTRGPWRRWASSDLAIRTMHPEMAESFVLSLLNNSYGIETGFVFILTPRHRSEVSQIQSLERSKVVTKFHWTGTVMTWSVSGTSSSSVTDSSESLEKSKEVPQRHGTAWHGRQEMPLGKLTSREMGELN